jgi:quinol monooxygenase YgiN
MKKTDHHMINAVYVFKPDRKSAKGLTDLLNKVVERVKYAPGCQQSEVWHRKASYEIMLFETWMSMNDLKKHIQSPVYKWVLAAIDMSAGEPCIRFAECDNLRGIDMIEKIILKNAVETEK